MEGVTLLSQCEPMGKHSLWARCKPALGQGFRPQEVRGDITSWLPVRWFFTDVRLIHFSGLNWFIPVLCPRWSLFFPSLLLLSLRGGGGGGGRVYVGPGRLLEDMKIRAGCWMRGRLRVRTAREQGDISTSCKSTAAIQAPPTPQPNQSQAGQNQSVFVCLVNS